MPKFLALSRRPGVAPGAAPYSGVRRAFANSASATSANVDTPGGRQWMVGEIPKQHDKDKDPRRNKESRDVMRDKDR